MWYDRFVTPLDLQSSNCILPRNKGDLTLEFMFKDESQSSFVSLKIIVVFNTSGSF